MEFRKRTDTCWIADLRMISIVHLHPQEGLEGFVVLNAYGKILFHGSFEDCVTYANRFDI